MGAYPLYSDVVAAYDICDNMKDAETAYNAAWCLEFLKTGGPNGSLIHPGETARSAGAVPDGDDAYFGIYASPWTGELVPLSGFEEVSLSLDGIPSCTGDGCLPKYKVGTSQLSALDFVSSTERELHVPPARHPALGLPHVAQFAAFINYACLQITAPFRVEITCDSSGVPSAAPGPVPSRKPAALAPSGASAP